MKRLLLASAFVVAAGSAHADWRDILAKMGDNYRHELAAASRQCTSEENHLRSIMNDMSPVEFYHAVNEQSARCDRRLQKVYEDYERRLDSLNRPPPPLTTCTTERLFDDMLTTTCY